MNKPKPNCHYCHGTGQVVDYVPYGSTNVPMYSDCDCMYEDDEEEWILCSICEGTGEVEITLVDTKKVTLAVCLTCNGAGEVTKEKYQEMLSCLPETRED